MIDFKLKNKWDYDLVMDQKFDEGVEEGKIEGKIEGILEGRIEGKLESKLEIARNLKKIGISDSDITKATGLSIETIKDL